jgi:hypothetical protein
VRGEEQGEFTASITRLLSCNAPNWHLKQFNPPRGQKAEFTWTRKEWPKALRVVGNTTAVSGPTSSRSRYRAFGRRRRFCARVQLDLVA